MLSSFTERDLYLLNWMLDDLEEAIGDDDRPEFTRKEVKRLRQTIEDIARLMPLGGDK